MASSPRGGVGAEAEVDEDAIRRLMSLGLSRGLAIKALRSTNKGDELAAVRYAMEHFEMVKSIFEVCVSSS